MGFSQFHPLRSMQKSHTAEAKEAERCCQQVLKAVTTKNQVQPLQELKGFTAVSWDPGTQINQEAVLNLLRKASGPLTTPERLLRVRKQRGLYT